MDIKGTSKELLDSVGKVLTTEAKFMPDPMSVQNIKANDKGITELLKAQKILVKLNKDIQKSKFVPNNKFLSTLDGIQFEVGEIELESGLSQSRATGE
tara:strand:- start:450 stop:743 length:294 start_codon:yes stop_codon:yes gene_type:complete